MIYSIRFTNGQHCLAFSEEEARAITGNKSELFSMNEHQIGTVIKFNKEGIFTTDDKDIQDVLMNHPRCMLAKAFNNIETKTRLTKMLIR